MCAKWATLSFGLCENCKYNSYAIIKGIKYFAFIGIGGNNNINLASGNNIPKATKTPKIAPEAPTATDKYDDPNA